MVDKQKEPWYNKTIKGKQSARVQAHNTGGRGRRRRSSREDAANRNHLKCPCGAGGVGTDRQGKEKGIHEFRQEFSRGHPAAHSLFAMRVYFSISFGNVSRKFSQNKFSTKDNVHWQLKRWFPESQILPAEEGCLVRAGHKCITILASLRE